MLRGLTPRPFLRWPCNSPFCFAARSLRCPGLCRLVRGGSLLPAGATSLPGSRFPAVAQTALSLKAGLRASFSALLCQVRCRKSRLWGARGPDKGQWSRVAMAQKLRPEVPCGSSIRKLLEDFLWAFPSASGELPEKSLKAFFLDVWETEVPLEVWRLLLPSHLSDELLAAAEALVLRQD